MKSTNIQTAIEVGRLLEGESIPYQFTYAAALLIQGVSIQEPIEMTVDVQWDLFNEAHRLFTAYSPSQPTKTPEYASFQFSLDDQFIRVACRYNTTIKTNPYRISMITEETELWCQSLYSYFYDEEMAVYANQIHTYLAGVQQGFTKENEAAWNQNNYVALVNRYGEPEQLAPKILHNPKWRLQPFYRYMGNVHGKKVMHLMGSNGVKAVAIAALGAEVKVVDFSRENAAFAKALAEAAQVSVDYIISDVLSLTKDHANNDHDLVLMELGVLHYLIDLAPLMDKIQAILKPGGQFILHEFHPISTKLITSSGKKHKVTGNYFDPTIESTDVAFFKHMPDGEQGKLSQVVQRKWTIGELVTAVGKSGLVIKVLEEEPNHKMHDIGLPKTYTLVAEKRQGI
ncbi:class I SAM-dependent methyltransferase [Peribacillus loiseleuriae]|uniref:class I SAM-dependent methyltransferase n=1 Tax=Peribacillus loiseleuriae TaxID=1679170 RepID=UPI000ADE2F75|nr:class I SAM-dependent methyltransferase [Peribacillus loiseleuriae]